MIFKSRPSSDAQKNRSTFIDPDILLGGHDGPTALLDSRGALIQANDDGRRFMEALPQREKSARAFSILLARAALERTVVNGRVRVCLKEATGDAGRTEALAAEGGADGLQSFDVVLLPCTEPGGPLVMLARNATAETNLTIALAASRELYRDLVTCSADFSWETDHEGAFIFVNKRGAFGYRAAELNGLPAARLLQATETQSDNPFMSRTPVEEREVWIQGKDGTSHCVLISALPVYDRNGTWRGTRGVGRDITELKHHEEERARNQRRNAAIAAVVTAIQNELDPQEIIFAAAKATLDATGAQISRVYRTDENGAFSDRGDHCVEACLHTSPYRLGASLLSTSQIEAHIATLSTPRTPQDRRSNIVLGTWNVLTVLTEFQGRVNGALTIARPLSEGPWMQDTSDLLADIANHVGLAIAQANQIESLRGLSSKDPLTGLLNRRAFMELAAKRLAQHVRQTRPASFLYVDVDHFKSVNDEAGHGRGDEVLVALARQFERVVRKADLIVRFGGDEFGIWLEECDAECAILKAEEILAFSRSTLGTIVSQPRVGLSLGVAVFDPYSQETLEHLIERADRALYEAKRRGKNQWAMDTPATPHWPPDKEGIATC